MHTVEALNTCLHMKRWYARKKPQPSGARVVAFDPEVTTAMTTTTRTASTPANVYSDRGPRQVRKSHQLEEVAALMDELAPSVRSASRGGSAAAEKGGSPGNSSSSGGDVDSSGSSAASAGENETVIGRCAAAALSTGVDCVLDEEFSASREAARVTGFPQVGSWSLQCICACGLAVKS